MEKIVIVVAAFALGLGIGLLYKVKAVDPLAVLETQGQREWPYYANYASSQYAVSGVPINSTVERQLRSAGTELGIKDEPDVVFNQGAVFKDDVRHFAVAALKYPKAPVYGVESYDGRLGICIGDYGNCAGYLPLARTKH